jgi:hypothetical protein
MMRFALPTFLPRPRLGAGLVIPVQVGCVSAPTASTCELISVWWGLESVGELHMNYTPRAPVT